MRVLLIASDPRLTQALTKCLEKEGYTVAAALDAREGAGRAEAEDFEAVLLDLDWPDIDALSLLKQMRQGGVRSALVVLTGSNVRMRVAALNLGADDALAKPFQSDELLARLRAKMRRTVVPEDVLRVHDLELNMASRRVRRNGREIWFTRTEFALLNYLAQRRGKVATRQMLWEEALGKCGQPSSNIIEVYIRYLRCKIDRNHSPPLILTVRGQGYRFGAD